MSRRNKPAPDEFGAFICSHCGRAVPPPQSGTQHRNHCLHCLHSRHVDLRTGDRRSGCRGLMEPVSVWVMPDGEWALIHRCRSCGFIRSNRIAGDDNEAALLALAIKPVTGLPFPVGRVIENLSRVEMATETTYEE